MFVWCRVIQHQCQSLNLMSVWCRVIQHQCQSLNPKIWGRLHKPIYQSYWSFIWTVLLHSFRFLPSQFIIKVILLLGSGCCEFNILEIAISNLQSDVFIVGLMCSILLCYVRLCEGGELLDRILSR